MARVGFDLCYIVIDRPRVPGMPKSPRLRFAFALLGGPNDGLRCGGWRVWTKAEDTYITDKNLGDTWKVSLHGDEAWRVAMTSENEASENPVLPKGHDRALWKFTPPPFVDGQQLAFVVAVTRGALRPEPVDPNEMVVEVADSWDRITGVYLRMTEPGVALDGSHLVLGRPLPLDSGRQVWLTVYSEPIEPAEPEPVPVSAMIEPMSPETHDVTAPGLIVKGIHIG